MHGKLAAVGVLQYVPAQEARETVFDQRPDFRYVEVFREKRRQAGEETVRERFFVNLFENIGRRQAETREKFLSESRRELVFQAIADQRPAENGPAAFVAEDESERRDVGRNFGSVVQAGVRAGSEDTGDAGVAAAQRAGGCQHVAAHFDVRRRETGGQDVADHGDLIGESAAGSVKADLFDRTISKLRE